MFDLTGKFALVTGASGGIGSAIAEALHAQGATVTLSGTRREALEALAARLGDRTHIVTANLSDRGSVERWCRKPRRPWRARHSRQQCRHHAG